MCVNTRLHHYYNTSTQEHQARTTNKLYKARITLSREEVLGLSTLKKKLKYLLLQSADFCKHSIPVQHS